MFDRRTTTCPVTASTRSAVPPDRVCPPFSGTLYLPACLKAQSMQRSAIDSRHNPPQRSLAGIARPQELRSKPEPAVPRMRRLAAHDPHVVYVVASAERQSKGAVRAFGQPRLTLDQASRIADVHQANRHIAPEHRHHVVRSENQFESFHDQSASIDAPVCVTAAVSDRLLITGVSASVLLTARRIRCLTAPSTIIGRLSITLTLRPRVVPAPITSSVISSPTMPGTWLTACNSFASAPRITTSRKTRIAPSHGVATANLRCERRPDMSTSGAECVLVACVSRPVVAPHED